MYEILIALTFGVIFFGGWAIAIGATYQVIRDHFRS